MKCTAFSVSWGMLLRVLVAFLAIHFADVHWQIVAREGNWLGSFTLLGIGITAVAVFSFAWGLGSGVWQWWSER